MENHHKILWIYVLCCLIGGSLCAECDNDAQACLDTFHEKTGNLRIADDKEFRKVYCGMLKNHTNSLRKALTDCPSEDIEWWKNKVRGNSDYWRCGIVLKAPGPAPAPESDKAIECKKDVKACTEMLYDTISTTWNDPGYSECREVRTYARCVAGALTDCPADVIEKTKDDFVQTNKERDCNVTLPAYNGPQGANETTQYIRCDRGVAKCWIRYNKALKVVGLAALKICGHMKDMASCLDNFLIGCPVDVIQHEKNIIEDERSGFVDNENYVRKGKVSSDEKRDKKKAKRESVIEQANIAVRGDFVCNVELERTDAEKECRANATKCWDRFNTSTAGVDEEKRSDAYCGPLTTAATCLGSALVYCPIDLIDSEKADVEAYNNYLKCDVTLVVSGARCTLGSVVSLVTVVVVGLVSWV